MTTKYYKSSPQSFWELYQENISPRLKELDVMLKSDLENISTESVAMLLGVPNIQMQLVMEQLCIKNIDKSSFFDIVVKCDSYICNTLKHELECGLPKSYSYAQVSYIYDLDYKKVKKAFEFLGLNKISSANLKAVFAQIYL